MDNRRFGVEIECGGPDRDHDADDWEHQEGQAERTEKLLRSKGFPDWCRIGYDGTEIEIHSPILSGREGFEQLKRVMDLLVDKEYYTTDEDGLHIHHDAPEFVNNKALIVKLVQSWLSNQDLIGKFVDSGRWEDADEWGVCPPWNQWKLDHLMANGEAEERDALNIRALNRYGTIEFRLHEGTIDYDEASSWIKFGQYFLKAVLEHKNPLAACYDTDTLVKTLKVSPSVTKKLRPYRATSSSVSRPDSDRW